MKKLLVFFLCSLAFLGFGVSNSSAAPISVYWDLISDFDSNGSTTTDDFYQINYRAHTSSFQYDTDGNGLLNQGDVFVDYGNAGVVDLTGLSSTFDDNNLNDTNGYQVSFVWDDLTGVIFDVNPGDTTDTVVTRYQSGTINFYVDYLNDDPDPWGGSGDGAWDFGDRDLYTVDDDTGFGPGTLIASVDVYTGTGANTFEKNTLDMLTGSFYIEGKFNYLLDGFWFHESGVDLEDYVVQLDWLIGWTSGENNQRNFIQTFGGTDFDSNPILYRIDSDHVTQFEMFVVPEPTTIMLLGIGLLGLAGVARRKNIS